MLLPLARLLLYPWAWLFALLRLPWVVARGLCRCCARCCRAQTPEELSSPLLGGAPPRTMKPPIDLDGADAEAGGASAAKEPAPAHAV